MGFGRYITIALLMIFLSFVSTHVSAFDIWKFKSGADKAVLEESAKASGYIFQDMDPIVAIHRRDNPTENYKVYLLRFCENKLYRVTKPIAFEASSFANLLWEYSEKFGTPNILSRRDIREFNTSDVVEYTWVLGSDKISLGISTPLGVTYPVRLVQGSYEEYTDLGQCSAGFVDKN